MFGGLCFMLNGHMCCGIETDRLMIRVSPDCYEELLKKPHVQEMDFTGKPLKGFLFISKAGYQTKSGLASWIEEAIECAESKPPKKKKANISKELSKKSAVDPGRFQLPRRMSEFLPNPVGFTS